MSDSWEQIKGWLAAKLPPGAYQNWISRTAQGSLQDGELTVRVPDETAGAWIRQEYTPQIRTAIEELRLPVRTVHYQTESLPALAVAAKAPASHFSNGHVHPAEPLFEKPLAWLNPRLTFETYVVGSSNQLAHAAAQAVANLPSRSYNQIGRAHV